MTATRSSLFIISVIFGLVWSPDSYADACLGQPEEVKVPYLYDIHTNPSTFVPDILLRLNNCMYKLANQTITSCGTETPDDDPVYCDALYVKEEEFFGADTMPDDAFENQIPDAGCGTITTVKSGTKNYCFYDGEGESDEIKNGWHSPEPGKVLPGNSPDDIKTPLPNGPGTDMDCEPGYHKAGDSETYCVKDTEDDDQYYDPNYSPGEGGTGNPLEGPPGGGEEPTGDDTNDIIEFCLLNPQSFICQDSTLSGPDSFEVTPIDEIDNDDLSADVLSIDTSSADSSLQSLSNTVLGYLWDSPASSTCPLLSYSYNGITPTAQWTIVCGWLDFFRYLLDFVIGIFTLYVCFGIANQLHLRF